jgi:diguanylate cyclase (GGDEF)-like protein
MVAVLEPPLSDHYYVGLILVLSYACTFAQLRFTYAAISGLVLFVSYIFVVAYLKGSPSEVIANNTAFVFSSVYIGLFACALFEGYRRRNYWQIRKIEEISARDDLTGLLNRRQQRHVFALTQEGFRLRGEPTAALIIDVDNFKTINDQNGHETGDRILRHTAEIITDTLAGAGTAFRHGGDEFLVLMPGLTSAEAEDYATRMILDFDRMARRSLPHTPDVGLSIGISELDHSAACLEDLLRLADEALYAAKQHGKRRVVVHANTRGPSRPKAVAAGWPCRQRSFGDTENRSMSTRPKKRLKKNQSESSIIGGGDPPDLSNVDPGEPDDESSEIL